MVSALVGLALVALPFVISPGASFSLVLAHTLAGQRGAVTRIAAGTAGGLLLLAVVVVLSGLGTALHSHPLVRAGLALIGGAVLLSIAVRTIASGLGGLRAGSEENVGPVADGPAHLVRWSFLVLITNSKALTLYAVVVPSLASPRLGGAPLYLAFALIHATLMAAWLAAVGWAARHLPGARSPRPRAIIMLATGAALAVVAITTAASGLR